MIGKYALASDPETGEFVRVWWNEQLGQYRYAFNGGFAEALPAEIEHSESAKAHGKHALKWVAMELLRRRLNAAQWSEQEELTLP